MLRAFGTLVGRFSHDSVSELGWILDIFVQLSFFWDTFGLVFASFCIVILLYDNTEFHKREHTEIQAQIGATIGRNSHRSSSEMGWIVDIFDYDYDYERQVGMFVCPRTDSRASRLLALASVR